MKIVIKSTYVNNDDYDKNFYKITTNKEVFKI